MSVRFLEPHEALQKYIRHYAYCEIGRSDEWSPTDMASPGCTALAIALQRNHILLKKDGKEADNFKAITYTGQVTRVKHFDFYDKLKLFFVIFRPCGAFPLLGIHQEECKNRSLNFSDVMGSSVQYFEEELTSQDQAEEAKKIIDRFLLQRISGNTKKQARRIYQSRRLTEVIKQIRLYSHIQLSIKELCRQTGYSLSTLERRMKKIVGTTPKKFQRVMRFNRVLKYINLNPTSLRWSQIAQQFGYYDQAHFIKEFSHFYGKTPANYSFKDGRAIGVMAVQNSRPPTKE